MKTIKKYEGVVVPMVTPLCADFTLDETAAKKLMAKIYEANVQAFILGTTGEAASLPLSVKLAYLKVAAVQPRNGHLYVGISSNVFEESLTMAQHAAAVGADVVVATIPSYYALTASQTLRYFSDLAAQSPLPLVIYNIPATTHVSIPLQLIEELSEHPNIVGLKDSERSDERLAESVTRWKDRSDFSHFVGWAAKSADALFMGSDGIIPSTGNIEAAFYDSLLQAARKGDATTAQELQRYSDALGTVYQAGKTLGESLWALKVLLASEGIGEAVVMPPLQALSSEEESRLIATYQNIRK